MTTCMAEQEVQVIDLKHDRQASAARLKRIADSLTTSDLPKPPCAPRSCSRWQAAQHVTEHKGPGACHVVTDKPHHTL
jgi:hypothetical protein